MADKKQNTVITMDGHVTKRPTPPTTSPTPPTYWTNSRDNNLAAPDAYKVKGIYKTTSINPLAKLFRNVKDAFKTVKAAVGKFNEIKSAYKKGNLVDKFSMLTGVGSSLFSNVNHPMAQSFAKGLNEAQKIAIKAGPVVSYIERNRLDNFRNIMEAVGRLNGSFGLGLDDTLKDIVDIKTNFDGVVQMGRELLGMGVRNGYYLLSKDFSYADRASFMSIHSEELLKEALKHNDFDSLRYYSFHVNSQDTNKRLGLKIDPYLDTSRNHFFGQYYKEAKQSSYYTQWDQYYELSKTQSLIMGRDYLYVSREKEKTIDLRDLHLNNLSPDMKEMLNNALPNYNRTPITGVTPVHDVIATDSITREDDEKYRLFYQIHSGESVIENINNRFNYFKVSSMEVNA